MADKKQGALIVLKSYFGFKDGQTLKEFVAELKDLSDEDKLELAQAVAEGMGLTQDEVSFKLA